MTLSRRDALKLGLGAGAMPLLGGFPMPALDQTATRNGGRAVLRARALPLSAVRLTGGPLKHAQDLDRQYLLALEPDRMLAYFRQRAGLAPKAEPQSWRGAWTGGPCRRASRLASWVFPAGAPVSRPKPSRTAGGTAAAAISPDT